MAWGRRRQPISQSLAVRHSYNGTAALICVSEYDCPKCGAPPSEIQCVIVQWAGTIQGVQYTPGMPVPANSPMPASNATRTIGFKCRKCGYANSGSTALTMKK